MGKIITYKNEERKGIYCQIKLLSGERILISIAQPGAKIYKLSFGGLIPTQTIWESNDVSKMVSLFANVNEPQKPLLDTIIARLIDRKSIAEIRQILNT
jgi:hypothetical protein